MRLVVHPGGALRGEIRVAADKSVSHRAIMLASIAEGASRVRNLLQGEDVRATLAAFRAMGVRIREAGGAVEIDGVGLRGLRRPQAALDLGNSATALRLLAGLLCGQDWPSELSGDASLRARPMERILEPLARMGARIGARAGKPPLRISPAPLRGIQYEMPIASAQVKSCVLLAGLCADGETAVREPAPTRDHTERMLAAFGCEVRRRDGRITVRGGATLRGCEIEAPADLSSAAFFLVGASVIRGSDVLLRGVGVNPSRAGVLDVLKRMGADLELHDERLLGAEPVADIRVRAAELRGCRIGGRDIALSIDEIPALAVAAACARGATEISDAAELRVKESDRIGGVAAGLAALGAAVEERADGMRIQGGGLRGGRVDSCGDHRIAMAFALAGGAARGAVEIDDCENIATSFPDFCSVARGAGLDVQSAPAA